MHVTIEFLGQARELAGSARRSLEVAAACTALEAVQRAVDQEPPALRELLLTADGSLHTWVMLSVNDVATHDAATTLLTDGATLRLMPPISGG